MSPLRNNFLGGSLEIIRGSIIDVAPGLIEFQASEQVAHLPTLLLHIQGTATNRTVSPNIVAII